MRLDWDFYFWKDSLEEQFEREVLEIYFFRPLFEVNVRVPAGLFSNVGC